MTTTDSLSVRPYGPADHQEIVALWAATFPDDPPRSAPEAMISNKLGVQPQLFLVAQVGEELVGAVMAGFDGTRG